MTVYRVLATHLQGTADAAQKFMGSQLGLSGIKVEQEIHPHVEFRPTLQAVTLEKQIVCVEVVDSLYPTEVKEFVLSCRNHSVPAKLYCAFPKGSIAQVDTKALQFASENGIGILEIDAASSSAPGKVLNQAPVALSLGGLRKYRLSDYPPRLRVPLQSAIDTFRGGNPSKGCSEVYDEIEALCRKLGKKAEKLTGALKKPGVVNWDKDAWHNILEFLKNNLDIVVAGCPLLRHQLFSRLMGMTEYRNETGHKPTSVKKMIERDIALKTRFESAMDELAKLLEAVKPLKL